MRTALLAFAVAVLSASPSFAVPLTAAGRPALAGEWRASQDGQVDACGQNAKEYDRVLQLEFALTGGQFYFNDGDGSEDAVSSVPIKAVDTNNGALRFGLADGGTWLFRSDGKHLTVQTPPAGREDIKGAIFTRCREPADRSAIKLSKAQIAEISSALPPQNYIFVDARAKAGCKALDYQYVFFDLVGPLGFSAGRWNSYHLAERLAGGKKPSLAIDEIANFTIDKAEAAPNGIHLTLTELIPPNGSRGDTATITLTLAKNGTAAIPEWKRTYRRCADSELAAR